MENKENKKKDKTSDFREKAHLHELEEHKRLNKSGDISDFDLAHGAITASALTKMDFLKPKHGDTWGNWKYNDKNLTLTLLKDREGNFEYEIDLETCGTAGGFLGVLDRITQIAKKTWADADIVGNLVFALDDLLDLQGNVVHLKSREVFDIKAYLWYREKNRD